MRRRRSTVWFWLGSVGVCLVGIGSVIAVVVMSDQPTGDRRSPDLSAVSFAPEPAGPRRIPVTGASGFFVIVNPDGTSYLEKPSGATQVLVDDTQVRAGQADVEKHIRRKVEEAVQAKPKVELGQVIVLDKGIVDVPKGAVVTFIGADKVVVLNDDGVTSTVFHADGRVEKRDRKKPLPQPSGLSANKE